MLMHQLFAESPYISIPRPNRTIPHAEPARAPSTMEEGVTSRPVRPISRRPPAVRNRNGSAHMATVWRKKSSWSGYGLRMAKKRIDATTARMNIDASHGGPKRLFQIGFWNAGSVDAKAAGGIIPAHPCWD